MLVFKNSYFLTVNITLLLIFAVKMTSSDESDNNIPKPIDASQWANDIGSKFWEIGKKVTKLEAIKKRYKEMNATVQPTDGEQILRTIVVRMNKLIKEKVDAVMRIQTAAVKASESESVKPNMTKEDIPYRSSKFSSITVTDTGYTIAQEHNLPANLTFENMDLTRDQHFNNVLVNTSYSSVHVPTNIYDRWDKVIEPIIWSLQLDATFRENYDKDPSLMWQYFASTSGFLRHYPAYHWSMNPDKYDCRKRIWYVQAATCSKEVIIMIDNSGTMYGMRNTIAQLTVDSLLQTFSNNDYVNVFQLRDEKANYLVDCFNDTLVQATPENVELFKQSLYSLCPGNKTNFTTGFLQAFQMLHNFIQNKTEQAERRNQAIFLLTDMLPAQSELDSIRKKYNEIYKGTNVQVDLFMYFIGKDVTDTKTIQWENKCLRSGSIVHVRTMDEVPEDVLKYLPVIARTQNENTLNYPVSWTHVFLDTKKDKGKLIDVELPENEDEHPEYGNLSEPFIMTSVTTPVYKKLNLTQLPGKEEMIGVAAIDVPVSDFERLVISHKIGVNGYAFIVTNNGYLLFHPDLTPVKDGAFRINFNSVDLTEIEFFDDDVNEPRKPNENIVELRRRMVNQEHGTMENMTIKFHYDNQTRVGSELRNYYYAPLKCSPFTLGLALPKGYGNYWIKTMEEINITKLKEDNYSRYFDGDNWNIHPKWTYCDFRTREKYAYETPRKKLEKFLQMIFVDENSDFQWYDEHQMGEDEIDKLDFTDSFDQCFANDTTHKPTEDYFCDRELMEVLFFDAKLTHEEFAEKISPDDEEFFKSIGIQVKFVSTQSGLTRWKVLEKDAMSRNFGETNNKALDEVWYKSAVLLHETKSQYFVFSLPKDHGNSENTYITASHAIFHNNSEENEAPGVVVGYEMAYESFKDIIESNSACNKSHYRHDCYVIDTNGYIVYADKDTYLGEFFGEIEGAVLEQLIKEGVFRELSMYDYQAFDTETKPPTPSTGSASFLFNPFNHFIWMTQWMFSKILWIILETSLWMPIHGWKYCNTIETPQNKGNTMDSIPSCFKAPKRYSDSCSTREFPPHILREGEDASKSNKKPVDKRFSLYLSPPHGIIENPDRTGKTCARPFEAHRIPWTNLILITIDAGHQTCIKVLSVKQEVIKYYTSDVIKLITDPKKLPEGKYIDTPACNKKTINAYPRKKLRGCSDKLVLNSTDNETCGSGRFFSVGQSLLVTLICNFVLLFHYLLFCCV